jgi:hypothetical protein
MVVGHLLFDGSYVRQKHCYPNQQKRRIVTVAFGLCLESHLLQGKKIDHGITHPGKFGTFLDG